MRIRLMAALAVALGFGTAARAQSETPTVEVRLQSVNVLLEKAQYIAGLGDKEDVVLAVKQIIKGFTTEEKGIEGIDPKRPFGLYASLNAEVVNSAFTVMVPIADKDQFLSLLKDKLDIVPMKADGGALKIDLPEAAKNPVINSLYIQFANDYLYVARSAKDLDAKNLIAPKAFFAKDDGALVSVVVRGDNIPAEVKTFVVGQFELFVAEERKKNAGNEKPAEKIVADWLAGAATGGIKTFFEDTKALSLRVFVDDKADEMSAEVVLTPKAGSPMAKYITSLAGNTSLPAGIVSQEGAVARGVAKVAMSPEIKKSFGKMLDDVIQEGIKEVGQQEKELLERVIKTLAPTVKAGELDLAVGLYGPDSKGKYAALAALAIKSGKEVEKLARDMAGFAAGVADITFDVDTVGDFKLHKIVLNDVPPEVDRIFGTKTIWAAISENHLVVSMEPEGTAIKAALKAKAAPTQVLNLEVSLAKLFPLITRGDVKPDELQKLMKETFGDAGPNGKDKATIAITGGDLLTVKAKVQGKGVKLWVSSLLKEKE